MRIKPGLPVAASVVSVVVATGWLLASVATRPDTPAPCPGVEGRSPEPTPSPGVCPGVTVTVLPSPTVVTTVVTPGPPVVVRQPGTTRTVVITPAPPSRTRTPGPKPSRTVSPTPSPTPCPLPTVPVVGCPGHRRP